MSKVKKELPEKIKDLKILAQNSYYAAESFYSAYLLLQNNSKPPAPFFPMITLCAFTCELYLKSLLYLEFSQDPQNKTPEYAAGCFKKIFDCRHNLYELFKMLDPNIKQEIFKLVPDESPYFIEEQLKLFSTYFEDFRYHFERVEPIEIHMSIFAFVERLKTIRGMYPPPLRESEQNINDLIAHGAKTNQVD